MSRVEVTPSSLIGLGNITHRLLFCVFHNMEDPQWTRESKVT
jgi:hypothetical protein